MLKYDQLTNFETGQQEYVSVADVACQIGVSIATIKNWVREKYLISENGNINQNLLHDFIASNIGVKKLNSRANKIYKNSHNHVELTDKILQKTKIYEKSAANISIEYEKSLSESYKNKEGIFYTPESIVENMLDGVDDTQSKTFLDPCCGSGNFIIGAIKKGFSVENVYGFDTDKNAVAITKKRIFDLTGKNSENIIEADFLETANKLNKKFDCIFTNPPWGKKLQKEIKQRYSLIYKTGKSIDTSSLFFGASLLLLKEDGKIGFLLSEAFFNILAFQDIRKKLLKYNIERFVDYGKPFDKLITKAKAVILSNKKDEKNIVCENGEERHIRTKSSFFSVPNNIFNFNVKNNDMTVINYVFETEHVTLKNNAQWGLGIVTGNNEIFCTREQKENYIPVFRGQDITKNGLLKPMNFISNDFSLYRQVAPIELYKAKEKLIYRFISSDLCFCLDNKQNFILNSANFLIPHNNFPISVKQLCDYLNSDLINWLFKSIFNTHKILRGDLEKIPIHYKFFEKNAVFCEKKYLDFLRIERINDGNYRKYY